MCDCDTTFRVAHRRQFLPAFAMRTDLAGKVCRGGAHRVIHRGRRTEVRRAGEVAGIERGLALHQVHVVAARPDELEHLPALYVHRLVLRLAAETLVPRDRVVECRVAASVVRRHGGTEKTRKIFIVHDTLGKTYDPLPCSLKQLLVVPLRVEQG